MLQHDIWGDENSTLNNAQIDQVSINAYDSYQLTLHFLISNILTNSVTIQLHL